MVERRPVLDLLAHLTLVLGVLIVAFPVWLAVVASTHPSSSFMSGTIPLWFGDAAPETYARMFGQGLSSSGRRRSGSCSPTA
jgi:sn-glycerol 3-phosphate transport system permease protein